MSILFYFIERFESPRLVDVTFLTKRMGRYKILARFILMISVIDFALAAPVVVQKRALHVSGEDDGTDTSPLRLANAAYRTNTLPIPRPSDSGHWLEQEPRQHNPIDSGSGGSKPLPLWDLNDTPPPSPTSQPPTNQLSTGEPSTSQPSTSQPPTSQPPHDQGPTHDSHAALSPSSQLGDAELSPPFYQAQVPTDDSHWHVLDPALSSDPLDGLLHSPSYETLPPHVQGATDDSHASNPSSPHSNTNLYLPSYQAQGPTDESHMMNPSSSHDNTDLNTLYYQAQGPTDESHVLNPTPALSSDSGSFLSGLLRTPPHDTPPSSSPQMASSPDSGGSHPQSPLSQQQLSTDGSHLRTSGPTDNSPASPSNPGPSKGPHTLSSAQLPNENFVMTDLENLFKSPYLDKNHPLSLGADHPLRPGPTDNSPQASPPNTGPSTERNPPPSTKRPRPEDDEPGSSLSKIFKGKFKRLLSGSGSLNAVQGEFQSTFKSSAYVTALSLPCQKTTVVTNILINRYNR